MAEGSQRYHAAFQVEIRYRRYLRPEDKRPTKEWCYCRQRPPSSRTRRRHRSGLRKTPKPQQSFFLGNSFFTGTRLRVRTAFLVACFVIAYFLGLTYVMLRAGTYFGLEEYSALVLVAVVFGVLAVRYKP